MSGMLGRMRDPYRNTAHPEWPATEDDDDEANLPTIDVTLVDESEDVAW